MARHPPGVVMNLVTHMIEWHGHIYLIEVYNNTWCKLMTSKYRSTKNRFLIDLVQIWFNSKFEMSPGEFIAKTTGKNCADIEEF